MKATKYLATWMMGVWCAVAFAGTGHGHGAQEEHDDHEAHARVVKLEAAQLATLNLPSVAAVEGRLTDSLSFPAEVQFDPTRVAHLTPRVSGIVKEVFFRLGDQVRQGDVLAILESRELGLAKSEYLAAMARQVLREKTHAREEGLWKKGISAEQEYLEAAQALEESRIEVRQARQALFSLGVETEHLAKLAKTDEYLLNRYAMKMPFEGTIIEQHITLGEILQMDRPPFVVADTDRMWVLARVNERDLGKVRKGQLAHVRLDAFPDESFSAKIDYVGSSLDRDTRTATARLVLKNRQGKLKAGMFGQVRVMVPNERESGALLLPKGALQRMEDSHVVFKQLEEGHYEMVSVTVVASSEDYVEVSGELKSGDLVATGDTFILKSVAGREAMGEGHSH